MGLDIEKETKTKEAGVENVTIDRHLYITEDGDRLVEEGDPAGRYLWASPGDEVSAKDAERLGLKSKRERKDKAASKPSDKAAAPSDDKSSDGAGQGASEKVPEGK